MSGRPAARVGDKVAGNVIVSGSATVLIGDAGDGRADKPCNGSPQVGSPVNPMLGSKVLSSEVDFELPALDPFVFERRYASDDARVGMLGPGWSCPGCAEGLELDGTGTSLVDPQGRRLAFGPLQPGESRFSVSEALWIRRGGALPTDEVELRRWGRFAQDDWANEDTVAVWRPATDRFHLFRRIGAVWRLVHRAGRAADGHTFRWTDAGDLHSVVDGVGRHYAFAYTRLGTSTGPDDGVRLAGVALVRDPGRHGLDVAFDPYSPRTHWLVRYHYGEQGDLVEVEPRDPAGWRHFAYENHVMVAHRDAAGREVRYRYDSPGPTGRVIEQHQAGGLSYRFEYQPTVTVVTDSLGRRERYEFAGEGGLRRLVRQVRADGSATVWTHDAAGRVITRTDPLGRTTRWRFDGQGRTIGVVHPDGAIESFTLDPVTGWRLAHADPLGHTTRFTWHASGDLSRIERPDGSVSSFDFLPAQPGRPWRVRVGDQVLATFTWDALGLPETVTDCSGHVTRYRHDPDGRLVLMARPGEPPTTVHLRADGRVKRFTSPDGEDIHLEHDVAGRLTAVRCGDDVERIAYDAWGRVIARCDAEGRVRRVEHDVAGRPVAVTHEDGSRMTLAYDRCDRLVAVTWPDSGQTQYQYDVCDDLIRVDNPLGQWSLMERDAAGRVVRARLGQANQLSVEEHAFRYDKAGRLIGATCAAAEIAWTLDPMGRAVQEVQRHTDGWTYRVGREIDDLGLSAVTRLPGLPPLRWLRYGSGHWHGLRLGAQGLDLERDELHREVRRNALGWSRETAWGVDDACDAQVFARANAEAPWQRRYLRDPAGRLVAIEDSEQGRLDLTPDRSGRLTPPIASGAPLAARHERDAAGRVVLRVTADDRRLSCLYDAMDRLVEVVDVSNGADTPCWRARYLYDPFGRRLRQEVQGPDGRVQVLHSGWDGDRLVCLDDGHEARSFVQAPEGHAVLAHVDHATLAVPNPLSAALDDLLSGLPASTAVDRVDAGPSRLAWYLDDAVGTPLRLVNDMGQQIGDGRYDPWQGMQPPSSGTLPTPARHPGQWFDAETGLHYNRHRYYDPLAGTYLCADPIGRLQGDLPHRYAADRPAERTDPLGLLVWMAIPGLCALGGCEALMVALGTATWMSTPGGQAATRQAGDALARTLAPPPPDCNQLNALVQEAKDAVGKLGKCVPGMSWWQLRQRHSAWLRLAKARARRDERCWGGGDEGHQNAQADAWQHAGKCQALM